MKKTSKKNSPTLVLWGQSFEDDLAIFFVSNLRKLGSHVKLVGIDGPCASGIYGVSLNVDITLDQILDRIDTSAGIIIPCDIARLTRMGNDPRMRLLLKNAVHHNVRIILKESIKNKIATLKWLKPYAAAIEFYAAEQDNIPALRALTFKLDASKLDPSLN